MEKSSLQVTQQPMKIESHINLNTSTFINQRTQIHSRFP